MSECEKSSEIEGEIVYVSLCVCVLRTGLQ